MLSKHRKIQICFYLFLSALFIEQCYTGLLTAPQGTVTNVKRRMVLLAWPSLAVSISHENLARRLYSVLLVVLVLVVCKFL